MKSSNQEIEVKFFVRDLPAIEARVQELEARLIMPRTHEVNLRFDRPGGSLSHAHQVLRLRQSDFARLTFKSPANIQGGVTVRQELEFIVSDFQTAQQFLEALDFQIIIMYEKFRAIYQLEQAEVTLDELPYGDFIEIEGLNAESLRNAAEKLGLNWKARISDSYLTLFEHLHATQGLKFRDLSFHNFASIQAGKIEDLGIRSADG